MLDGVRRCFGRKPASANGIPGATGPGSAAGGLQDRTIATATGGPSRVRTMLKGLFNCDFRLKRAQSPPLSRARLREQLQDGELRQLGTRAQYVKPHESSPNRFRADLSEIHRRRDAKVPLHAVLDPAVKYLWVATLNAASGCADIMLGYEYADENRHLHGHPTLAMVASATGIRDSEAFIAGELYCHDGVWRLNNDSGRYGDGNAAERKRLNISRKELLLAVTDILSAKTDLTIASVEVCSRNRLKRFLQRRLGIGRNILPVSMSEPQ